MTLTNSPWLNALMIIGAIGVAEEAARRLIWHFIGKPVVRTWRLVLRTWHQVERFLDTWNGEPERDGLAARPGLVTRVIAIEATLKRVDYHSRPNGGGSAYDALMREILGVAKSLDDHIADSASRIEQGDKDKHELQTAISNLSAAMPVVAASTPPSEDLT